MKKGFTLIEMLGVIVILSVIGLITVPIVSNVLNSVLPVMAFGDFWTRRGRPSTIRMSVYFSLGFSQK